MTTIGPSTVPTAAPALATVTDVAAVDEVKQAPSRPVKWTVGRILLTLLLIGFALAFPVAALLRAGASRAGTAGRYLLPWLYPLAGAVSVGTGLTIMFQQYEVTAVAGARGLGYWAQCVAGAIAGFIFQRVLMRRSAP